MVVGGPCVLFVNVYMSMGCRHVVCAHIGTVCMSAHVTGYIFM